MYKNVELVGGPYCGERVRVPQHATSYYCVDHMNADELTTLSQEEAGYIKVKKHVYCEEAAYSHDGLWIFKYKGLE